MRNVFIWVIGLLLIGIITFLIFLGRGGEYWLSDTIEEVDGLTQPHIQAVVSSHELATEAGTEILDSGGTAADAAVAVAAVLSVVEPWFSSVLGGGTWALYYDSELGEVTSLDGVGPTGSLATASDFRGRAGTPGMHQANVPGAWDGWMVWLEEYGNMDLGQVLAPAIRIARDGYEMSGTMAGWLSRQADVTLARPDTARIYAPNGELLGEGDTVYQLDMADTFEELVSVYDDAREMGRTDAIQAARDHFYRGPIAERIVSFSDERNGYLTWSDFEEFEAEIVDPISIPYSDRVEVFENPPNSQGITMLIALNVLRSFDFSEMSINDPDVTHLVVESIKRAFADRYYHVGDPSRIDVPVERLLSDLHTQRHVENIDMHQASTWPIEDVSEPLDDDVAHTTTFHVVDSNGNGAAVTTSLGAHFFVIPETGIHINHRMRFLAVDEGDPNQVTPGFKVRHTSNPYMAFRDGRLYILGGNTGADTQVQGQVQQFINVVEFGLSAQEAVARPRFVSNAFPSTIYPYAVRNTLQIENGFPSEVIEEMRSRGHDVVVGTGTWGSANMIIVNEDGSDADMGVDPRGGVSHGVKK